MFHGIARPVRNALPPPPPKKPHTPRSRRLDEPAPEENRRYDLGQRGSDAAILPAVPDAT